MSSYIFIDFLKWNRYDSVFSLTSELTSAHNFCGIVCRSREDTPVGPGLWRAYWKTVTLLCLRPDWACSFFHVPSFTVILKTGSCLGEGGGIELK